MYKIRKMFIVFLTYLLILSNFVACDEIEEKLFIVPDEIKGVREKVTQIAADMAQQLDREWGDKHVTLLRSKEGRSFAEYEEMRSVLAYLREISGAYYVYTLYPETPESPENFLLTVDGSAAPDDWFERYKTEPPFLQALAGSPSCLAYAWGNQDDGEDPCWSAFAPIHDSAGNVVCILVIDYPVPEMQAFPEWNKHKPEWNGIESSIEITITK